MAQRYILVDDIDGTEGKDIETIIFGLHGASYEVDLNKKNAKALEDALAPYLGVARKHEAASTRTRRSSAKRSDSPKVTPEDREWLRQNGFPDTKNIGRLSTAMLDALAKR